MDTSKIQYLVVENGLLALKNVFVDPNTLQSILLSNTCGASATINIVSTIHCHFGLSCIAPKLHWVLRSKNKIRIRFFVTMHSIVYINYVDLWRLAEEMTYGDIRRNDLWR